MRLRNLVTDESGTILPLIIGYAALAMALVVFATAAISLHVTQKRLDGVADASALAGAQGYVLAVAPNGATATLNPSDVRANAQRVAEQGDNVTLVSADVIDGTTATATVSTVWHPPILSPLVPDGFTLFATGTSRTALDGN